MPSVEVATRSYAPSELPTRSFPWVGAVDVPVPPLLIPRMPVTSLVRSTSAAATAPAVAFKNPVTRPKVNEFDATIALDEATPVTVAFVDVEFANVASAKPCAAVKVLAVKVFGIVVDE